MLSGKLHVCMGIFQLDLSTEVHKLQKLDPLTVWPLFATICRQKEEVC